MNKRGIKFLALFCWIFLQWSEAKEFEKPSHWRGKATPVGKYRSLKIEIINPYSIATGALALVGLILFLMVRRRQLSELNEEKIENSEFSVPMTSSRKPKSKSILSESPQEENSRPKEVPVVALDENSKNEISKFFTTVSKVKIIADVEAASQARAKLEDEVIASNQLFDIESHSDISSVSTDTLNGLKYSKMTVDLDLVFEDEMKALKRN